MKIIKSILSIAIAASLFSCGNQVKEVKSLETEIDSVSYAIGLSTGLGMSGQLKAGFEEVNRDVLKQAIRNGLDSTNLLLDQKDIQKVIQNYFQKKHKNQPALWIYLYLYKAPVLLQMFYWCSL